MIKFYYHPSPNPAKVALFLEEAGLEYELVPVDTRKGEQHSPGYLSINPNAKTPIHRRRRGDHIRFKRHPALSRREDRALSSREYA